MIQNKFILVAISALLSIATFGQKTTHIKGIIVDSLTNTEIPYSKVVLISNTSKSIIDGAITDESGNFIIVTDSTSGFLEISFMGYDNKTLDNLNWGNDTIDVGTIQISSSTQDIDEVRVTAEKSTLEFKLDKRVFNVGKDLQSTGLGAMDVLNNVPSVSVDIEGNIALRGNQGVQILINGKPSVLSDDPANALGTITADMIESIEVITNPSAKYDASGTSGIINIILKKDESKGINGSISVNTGWPHNHSIGGSINYRTKKFNLFTQFGAGYRSLPRYQRSETNNLADTTDVFGDGVAYRNENFYNITLGTDFYLNEYNTFTLSGNFAYEIESQPSETEISIYENNVLTNQYTRTEVTSALNPKYQYDFQYKKQFKNNKEHVLNISSIGRFFGKDQSSEFFNDYTVGSANFRDQQTNTSFFQNDQTYQIDYVNPFSKRMSVELGAMYNINDVGNDYEVFNEDNSGNFILDSSLTNNFTYNQKVLGVYSTASYEREKWGVKLGLRLENTDLTTYLEDTDTRNQMNYTNLFPTFHTSYKISKKFQLQAGYSKRIFRPRLWDLNPFFNIKNNFNIRTGNPDLLPEFADSYELTGILLVNKLALNSSLYFLYTTDVKENITTYSGNVTTTLPMNIGTNKKLGLEVNWKYPFAKWLTAMGDLNYGFFKREGEFESQNFDFEGDQWSGKVNLKFKLKKDVDFEFTTNYESKVQTVQGYNSGFAFVDAGIRKKIWDGKAVINFTVRDIFASRKRESFITQTGYTSYNFAQRGRFLTLGFSYSFGKGEAMSYTGGRR